MHFLKCFAPGMRLHVQRTQEDVQRTEEQVHRTEEEVHRTQGDEASHVQRTKKTEEEE